MEIVPNFDLILGIDQTGAVKKNGEPKPLDVAILKLNSPDFNIYTKLKLKSLSFENVSALVQNHTDVPNPKVLIAIDSVIGLPMSCATQISNLLEMAESENAAGRPFGSKAAFEFFKQFLSGADSNYPQREVEEQLDANSVFHLLPYQRNIGCGSYRILRELSADRTWFSLWPFQSNNRSSFVIAECYPTYFWKQIINSKQRNKNELATYISHSKYQVETDISSLSKDQIDALVLAVGAAEILNRGRLSSKELNSRHLQYEGWILGA